MTNNRLAINGGEPVRQKPFASSCYCSGNEKGLILECLESNCWSSFKGATEGWNIKTVGKMGSIAANKYGPLEIRFLGGKYIRQLEADFARYFGVEYAVSANSATSCLVMAIGALNLGPGDEVICPCMSFNATATSILLFNCVPIFAEVKSDTFCLDPEDVEAKITERTKAIMIVHLGGNTADMTAIMRIAEENNLRVIEDCAQAPGVTYKGKSVGTIGDVGIFSFTETKNITCGEGGMLITNNPDVAFKSRLIRNHGEGVAEESWTDEELTNVIGMNFRLTELQAAVAIPQFESIEERNRTRKENSTYLIDALQIYPHLISPQIEVGADYVCFMLKWKYIPESGMPSKEELLRYLQAEGIPVTGGYSRLMHENPLFARKIAYGAKGCPFITPCHSGGLRYGAGTLPRSEAIKKEFLWFKYINAPNTLEDMQDVVDAFTKILG